MKQYNLKSYLIIFAVTGALIAGCRPGKAPTELAVYPVDAVKKEAGTALADTMLASDRDTTIILKEGEAYIRGHINPKSKVDYSLPAWKNQEITAVVKAVSSKGNIRIGQIQKPGGDFDGPFGDSLVYKPDANGNVHFILGPNTMAESPFVGDFVLHIKVKD